MTDYLNPHRIYPDNPSRRIDNPPGFDSIRGNSDQEELSAYRSTGLTPEAVQEMVSFPYTADDDEEVTKMIVNQCVVCGAEMPEGDQVCKACRDGNSYSAITTIAEFLENIGEKQMAAELAGAVRALKGDRA